MEFGSYPLSEGKLALPYQRPAEPCRTFVSPAVERVISDMTARIADKDLARLFENAFPNTLDTTVAWHDAGHTDSGAAGETPPEMVLGKWEGAQSFVVTGDIRAEWLRDSTNQLLQYQALAKVDPKIHTLILGAINTQTEYVIQSPYCNAFQPPGPSKVPKTINGQSDSVTPLYEPRFVFECKYELDSLAAYLSLANTFHNTTESTEFLTPRWYTALETLLRVLDEQSESTFDPKTGEFKQNIYSFTRMTSAGTETLNLGGYGNPLNFGTGLVRSAFRPSDDATIFGFLIPANAMMVVELRRTARMLENAGKTSISEDLIKRAKVIEDGIWEFGVVDTKKWGKVFAYEVDGYGSHLLMDDANVPSLLALPRLGFISADHEVYQNTRKMILNRSGNPYYIEGMTFKGIGGKSLHDSCFSVTHCRPRFRSPRWRRESLATISLDAGLDIRQ